MRSKQNRSNDSLPGVLRRYAADVQKFAGYVEDRCKKLLRLFIMAECVIKDLRSVVRSMRRILNLREIDEARRDMLMRELEQDLEVIERLELGPFKETLRKL